MTKSRTLRRAGAVVLSLAMAATTVFAGGVDSKAASKVKLSSTSKTFAAKGGTATVKIKGATSAKISSTTVKSSKTSVATVKKSSKVKFKVTAKKNTATKKKTATITAKVKIAKKYQSKYTKKSYSLKYKVTVKAAAATPSATPGELKLDKVESAGRINVGTTAAPVWRVNILIAYFSTAISDLSTSDIEIRQVSNDKLYTVEKVVMASDKKSATLTLTGSSNAATGTDYLAPNTSYKMIVKSGSKTLEKEFVVPEVVENRIVTAYDSTKKTITAGGVKYDASAVTDDYFDLLGQNVTIENTQGKITKLTKLSSVVYGSYKTGDTANADKTITLTDINNADTTYTTAMNAAGDTITAKQWTFGEKGTSVAEGALVGVKEKYGFAKLIVSGSTVSRVIYTATQTKALATKVNGNYVTGIDKAEKNLSGYVIIKDGKIGAITDITEGTQYFIDAANKLAVIGGAGTEGAIEAVYTDSVKIAGSVYKYADLNGCVYTDGTATAASETNFNTLKSGGNVKVYKNGIGAVSFITGTAGQAATSTKTYILAKPFSTYSGAQNVPYLYATLLDGTDTLKLDIPVSQLTSVKVDDTAIVKKPASGTLKVLGTVGETNAAITANGTNAVGLRGGASLTVAENVADADAIRGGAVDVTFDKDNKVVGLAFHYDKDTTEVTTASDPALGQKKIISSADDADVVIKAGNKVAYDGGAVTTTSSTPVYVITYTSDDAAAATRAKTDVKSVTATTLDKYTGTLVVKSPAAGLDNTYVVYSGNAAKYIVIDSKDVKNTSTNVASTKEVIITDVKTSTVNSATNYVSLSYIETSSDGTAATTVEAFDTPATNNPAFAAGKLVSLAFDKDGKVVVSKSEDLTTAITIGTVASNTGDSSTLKFNGGNKEYKKGATNYVFKTGGSTGYTSCTWDDVVNDITKVSYAAYSKYQGVEGTIQTLIVTIETNSTAAAKAIEKTKFDNLTLAKSDTATSANQTLTPSLTDFTVGVTSGNAAKASASVNDATDVVTVTGLAEGTSLITVTVTGTYWKVSFTTTATATANPYVSLGTVTKGTVTENNV